MHYHLPFGRTIILILADNTAHFLFNAYQLKGSTAVENAPPHPQTIRSGDFFVVCGTEREPEQVKAGYHYGSGILPFAIFDSVWYTRLSPVNWKSWR